MRHSVKGRAFNRPTNQRGALMRSLARSLIIHEGISTTEAKAKELRPMIEKLVSTARVDSVANRRLVASRLGNDDAIVKKLFADIAPRYATRPGGYTRIVKRAANAVNARDNAYIAFV
ncbi:MAG TPA: 50S ribosomal protein L17 [Candidatus Paceibacterota bacterium]|nr:50S ribosomal protein L17 [Candidatus Paceibacterota bacterium]